MAKEKFPTLPTEGVFAVESFKAAGLSLVSVAEAKKLMQEASTSESRDEFEALVEREQAKLRQFFGKDIDVPPVPASVSPEQYERWKELRYELHYMPDEEMTEDKNFPGWKKKPVSNINLFAAIKDKNNKLHSDTLKLPGKWVLIDSREKPGWVNDQTTAQPYEDDNTMEQAIAELRARGLVTGDANKGARFRISWEELQKPGVKAKIAEILGVEPGELRLPRAIEYNFLGNAHYPKWGDTNSYEWFQDSYQGSGRLVGGDSGGGGLSGVGWGNAGGRSGNIGFRPLIVLS